jgi:hypothetical protein
VHGDCSSAGCYAMTDEQIQEIYALGRDSFIGGQKSFQVQAYPFRMTPLNMARHRNSPNMAFWRMIKEGNDHFEVTRQEPQVDVCEKHYVFDARAPADASTPVVFRARDKCPVYEVPEETATAVKEKRDSDERAFAEYANRGIATVAVRTGTDGGMHPLFLAKLHGQGKPLIDFAAIGRDINTPSAPLPPSVNPPHAPDPEPTASVASAQPAAPAAGQGSPLKTVGSTMARLFGLGSSEAAEAAPKAKPATAAATLPASAEKQAAARPAPASKPKPAPAVAQAANQPAPQPGNAAQPASLIAGAAPVVPAGTFESRWSGLQ